VIGAAFYLNLRRDIVKKTIVILLAALMFTFFGCQKKEEAGKAAAPSVAPQVALPQPVAPAGSDAKGAQTDAKPQTDTQQAPARAPAGGDPHANLRLKETPAGTGHKGKVLQVLEAGTYTYVEVEEKGQKLWIAALKTKVNKGDTVEFPDSKPMENFESKSLKRTFDKILFAESLRVVK
jgi:uncharacterized lipoprotein NlpE involved in copper resistance